jgi:ATP-binding cassette, subfamily C, bacterial CydC
MNDLIFFLRLFKPHTLWLIGGMLLSLLTSLSAISLLSLSGWFISASAIAGLAGDLMLLNIMLPAAQIRALAIMRTLARYAERVVTHEATFRVLSDIRVWFFAQLIPIALTRLALARSGDVLNRMTADIDALDALYLRLINPFVIAAIGIIGITLFLSVYYPLLAISVCLLLLLAAIFIPLLFNRLGQDSAENSVTLSTNLRLRQLDILQGMTDLLANNAYPRFVENFMKNSSRLLDTEADSNRLSALSSALTLLLSQLTLLLVLILLATQHSITGATLVMLFFCVLAAFELVHPLPNALQLLAKTQTSAKRVREFATLEQHDGTLNAPQQYDLRFEHISFRYHDKPWLIKNLSLTIPYGKKIALIGDSGAGKTTLLQLLTRHHAVQHGAIFLAGQNIQGYKHDELLSCIGVLSQRSVLFAATIKENLLIGNANAMTAELNAALKFAGLTTFVKRLPNGLNTWVGESGVKVSGGEARRIALARLYLKNPPILLLDEPTEGLDVATERDIISALAEFTNHKTLLMVTHRTVGLELINEIYEMAENSLLQITSL